MFWNFTHYYASISLGPLQHLKENIYWKRICMETIATIDQQNKKLSSEAQILAQICSNDYMTLNNLLRLDLNTWFIRQMFPGSPLRYSIIFDISHERFNPRVMYNCAPFVGIVIMPTCYLLVWPKGYLGYCVLPLHFLTLFHTITSFYSLAESCINF